MSPQQFLEAFEHLAETEGGVDQIRELVLTLAMTRRLEPATSPSNVTELGSVIKLRTGKLDANAADSHGEYPFFTCSRTPLTISSYSYDCECVLLSGNGDFHTKYYSGKFDAYQRTYIIEAADKDSLSVRYLLRVVDSSVSRLRNQSIGGVIKYLKKSHITGLEFDLPPLPEQKRIVEKVDQLMALCDELEAKQKEKREKAVSFNKAALYAVVQAPNKSALKSAWSRVQDHFEVLYELPENVKELRQTILQLAVMGKLVEQRRDEEPARELLARLKRKCSIQKRRNRKEGSAESLEPPFALPTGWAWASFPDLGEFGRGKSKHRPRNDPALYREGKYPLVQTGDVSRASPMITTAANSYNEVGLAQSKLWRAGTMCITIAANIADTGILSFDACFPDSVVGFVPDEEFQGPEYFEFFVRTMQDHLEDFAPSTAQKNINLTILEQIRIPLPPLGEQERIVEKVRTFMQLCDELEDRVGGRRGAGTRLMQSVVESLVA